MQDELHTHPDHAPFVKEEPANASMEGEYNIDDASSPYYVCTDHTTSRDEDDLTEVTPITQPDNIETTTFSIIVPEVLPLPGTQTGTTKDNAVVKHQTHNPSSSLTKNEVPKSMDVNTVNRRKGQQQTAPRERKIREKKHQCGLCNYAGQSLGHLRRHMMVHTGEKRHICSYCDFHQEYISDSSGKAYRGCGSKSTWYCSVKLYNLIHSYKMLKNILDLRKHQIIIFDYDNELML